MNNYMVTPKFNLGDDVYTIEKMKMDIPCEYCEGSGHLMLANGKGLTCTNCRGNGFLKSSKEFHKVGEHMSTIYEIRAIITGESTSYKYRVNQDGRTLNRHEEKMFATKEEAEIECRLLNTDTKMIKVKDIIIEDKFKEHVPDASRVSKKIKYFAHNRKFKKDIRIDKNNVLQDGYIDYLICGIFNLSEIRVIVI